MQRRVKERIKEKGGSKETKDGGRKKKKGKLRRE